MSNDPSLHEWTRAVAEAAALLTEWMNYGGNQDVRHATEAWLERIVYVVTDQDGCEIGHGEAHCSFSAEDAVWQHVQSSPTGVYQGVCTNRRGEVVDRSEIVLRAEKWSWTDVATTSGLWSGTR